MAPACPIAFRQIDGTVTRINALSNIIILTAYLFSMNIAFLYVLGIDLIIRLFINKRLSPINQVSHLIKSVFRVKTHSIDAGAKRLASYFALGFAWSVVIFHTLDFLVVAQIVTVIFLLCSSLEVLFNYCVGCKIYYIYKKLTV